MVDAPDVTMSLHELAHTALSSDAIGRNNIRMDSAMPCALITVAYKLGPENPNWCWTSLPQGILYLRPELVRGMVSQTSLAPGAPSAEKPTYTWVQFPSSPLWGC